MKKNIAVFFGGNSAEHDVSIITAHYPIIDSLLALKRFNVYPIYISRDGSWYSDQKMNKLQYFQKDNYQSNLKNKLKILFDDGLKIIPSGFFKKAIKIDVAFPAMHGTYGEDGSLMGLLRIAKVPFVGCDIFASAVAMDKVLTKQVVSAEGLPVVPYVWFTKNDWREKKQEILESINKLKLPLFIKPAHLGSSIGITKVKEILGLENAIEVALHYDDKILVEESVENLVEVTLPVVGNFHLELGAVEKPLNKSDFFSFSDKYISNNNKAYIGANNPYSEIPANIDKELLAIVQELGEKVYKVLGCSGIARIDLLIDHVSKKVYVNEVNTLPGSLHAHNWRKIGLSSLELVSKLINLAEEKFKEEQNTTYTFNSKIIKHAGGSKIR